MYKKIEKKGEILGKPCRYDNGQATKIPKGVVFFQNDKPAEGHCSSRMVEWVCCA